MNSNDKFFWYGANFLKRKYQDEAIFEYTPEIRCRTVIHAVRDTVRIEMLAFLMAAKTNTKIETLFLEIFFEFLKSVVQLIKNI
jgi:hypothetical protein